MLSVIQALGPVYQHYYHHLIIIVILILWLNHGHNHHHRYHFRHQQPLSEVQQAWEDCHQPEDIKRLTLKCYF